MSEEHNPVRENTKHVLIFCNFVEGAPMPVLLPGALCMLLTPWLDLHYCTSPPYVYQYVSVCLFGPLKQHLIGCLHCVNDEV